MPDNDLVDRARQFLRGETLKFKEADALWRDLKKGDELSLARRVLEQIRQKPECVSDGVPDDEINGVPIAAQHEGRVQGVYLTK
jgi:hypothetical protein